MAQSDRMSAGGTLEELWKSGRQGNLCPLEQVRTIALRDAYTDLPGTHPKSGGALRLSSTAWQETKRGLDHHGSGGAKQSKQFHTSTSRPLRHSRAK